MYLVITYIYFTICILILLYTISFIFFRWYGQQREIKHVNNYVSIISKQQQILQDESFIERLHIQVLSKRLKSVNQLIAFEKALNQLEKSCSISPYLLQLEPVIKNLVIHYQHRDPMEQAYLARFIATYAAKGKWHEPFIYQTLISYLDHATIYLRESVLLATYQQPDAQWIIKVFHYLTENDLFHHSKLIQDGLLQYPYDGDALIDELWKYRDTYHQHILLGLIGFITYKSDRYKEVFYQLLKENDIDLEVKIRLIRYFKKHVYPKVESLLIQLSKDKQDEIRIVAVHVLSEYKSEQVITSLKNALVDANYYVRRNASQSLLVMGVSLLDVMDVLTGKDRYAKEMLRYQLRLEGRELQ